MVLGNDRDYQNGTNTNSQSREKDHICPLFYYEWLTTCYQVKRKVNDAKSKNEKAANQVEDDWNIEEAVIDPAVKFQFILKIIYCHPES